MIEQIEGTDHHVTRTAIVSDCGRYRYRLGRDWDLVSAPSRVCWVMLNPSTADAETDDPTIRKCVEFSRRWGFTGLYVANVYAWRATQPADLFVASRAGMDIIGPDNERYVLEMHNDAVATVVAWGAKAGYPATLLTKQLFHKPLYCLGTSLLGAPKHPLYVPYETKLQMFTAPAVGV